jgi:hypothetical protein
MIANQAGGGATQKAIDDDSFLDWETRHESFPFHKHIIAGKLLRVVAFKIEKCYLIVYTMRFKYLIQIITMIGSCAGIMEHVGMFPLDTVKVSIVETILHLF